MRYSIDLLLCAALLFTGCKKDNVDVYTILSVYNRTEQHIKVISNHCCPLKMWTVNKS